MKYLLRKNNIGKGIALALIVLFVGISVMPSISGTINETRNIESADDTGHMSLQVTITKPENGIYCNDKKISPFFIPLILCGSITIEVEVIPSGDLDRIEFYINDAIQGVVSGPGPVYYWSLTWEPFSKINVGVKAYTFDGSGSDDIWIWRIFR